MSAISLQLMSQCLQECINENIAAFIWGPPGIGKSDLVHQTSRTLKYGLIDIRLSLRDPVDLRGAPWVDSKANVTRWMQPSELPQEGRDGKKGILFLDEANQANAAMQAAAMSLVLDRKLGEYELPPGWVPVAAGNRLIDKAAAQRLGTALRNRFAHFEVTKDLDSWVEWANKAGIDPIIISFIRFRPNLLHMMPEGDENCFPTPRAWEKASRFAKKKESIRQTLIASLVGDGPAAEFEGFARSAARLPKLEDILANPTRAKIPTDELHLLYAIAGQLSRRADVKNLPSIMTYTKRLPKEYQMIVIKDIRQVAPALEDTAPVRDWYNENQKIFQGDNNALRRAS